MKYLRIDKKTIQISFVSDYMMKKINYQYRNINKSTDVLSFRYNESNFKLIGEILISIKQVEKNCKKNRNSLLRETTIMCIHGILHLLGYNHQTEVDKKIMFNLQEKIYKKYF